MAQKQSIERQLIQVIATDRIDRPISSMSGKLKRAKKKLGPLVEIKPGEKYVGERVFARVETEDTKMAARTMREAVDLFAEQYPRHGKILDGYIEETRAGKETHIYFGMHQGKRLTADDYLGVMQNLGFTPATAKSLYPELMDISHKMRRKRNEGDRSILIG
jgi:hypothetical protein